MSRDKQIEENGCCTSCFIATEEKESEDTE